MLSQLVIMTLVTGDLGLFLTPLLAGLGSVLVGLSVADKLKDALKVAPSHKALKRV
ncbi:hypothetical protein COL9_12500 [Helicobacter pylori]